MTHRHQFIQRHPGHCRAQGFQPLDRLGLCITPHGFFGDQPGNRPAVPGYNDAFPALDFVKKLGQMGFCLGSLNFTHRLPTSCFDWSYYHVPALIATRRLASPPPATTAERTFENQRYRASGLNLTIAAITLWNTVYLSRAVAELRAQGEFLPDTLLGPVGWEHISFNGDYVSPSEPFKDGFRPLRNHRSAFLDAA
jgi:hypothetical protein